MCRKRSGTVICSRQEWNRKPTGKRTERIHKAFPSAGRDEESTDENQCKRSVLPGTYELLVGHASADIRVSCEIQFTTKKLLPFQVTGATPIGELLADSRTAAATMELLAPLQQTGENGEEISEADQQMIQAILEGLPLKSLSIAGVSGEMIEEIIHKLNELC